MQAALATLCDLASQGQRTVAVLGDMLELGADEDEAHRALGELTAGIAQRLVAFGPRSRRTAEAARAAGLSHVSHTEDISELVQLVASDLAPGDLLLVKGSRGNRLERLVEALGARADLPEAHG